VNGVGLPRAIHARVFVDVQLHPAPDATILIPGKVVFSSRITLGFDWRAALKDDHDWPAAGKNPPEMSAGGASRSRSSEV
jgi:hypothetical protein